MVDLGVDRRKHTHFRILFMDFRALWYRLLHGKRRPEGPPMAHKSPAASPKTTNLTSGNTTSRTGVPKLDEQHQEIRDAILQLQGDMRKGVAGQALAEALGGLLQKMNDHFSYEESYLEHIHYPGLENHRAEHQQLRTQLLHFQDRADQGDQAVSLELTNFLFNWFRKHTLEEGSSFKRGRPSQ